MKDGLAKGGLVGVESAQLYIRDRWANDINATGSKLVRGEWSVKADDIKCRLFDKLDPTKRDRIYTGLEQIEEAIAIGPKESTKYIGILGLTGHGKSALLLPILYNLARSGVNVLFAPRKFSVEDAWLRLTFMHPVYFPELKLCSLTTWELTPHLVTARDRESLKYIMDDLRNRKSIKGAIDVIVATTWTAIAEHVAANKSRYDYKVVAVDYMSHLDMPGKDRIEATKQVFRQAQKMCLDHNDGQGMVIITPLQANKEGKERANNREGLEWGSYEGDVGAIEYFTDPGRDMDAIFGVWSQGPLRDAGQMKVSCVKSRSRLFKPFLVQMDPNSRYFRTLKLSDTAILAAQGRLSVAPERVGSRRQKQIDLAYLETAEQTSEAEIDERSFC